MNWQYIKISKNTVTLSKMIDHGFYVKTTFYKKDKIKTVIGETMLYLPSKSVKITKYHRLRYKAYF